MKVIYNGLKEKEEMIYELKCTLCDSVFEYSDMELEKLGALVYKLQDGDHYQIECPVCKKSIYIYKNIIKNNKNTHALIKRKK